MVTNLIAKIKNKKARIAVCGLGYVGTPLAALLASQGLSVTGIDTNREKVKAINNQRSPFSGKEPGLNQLIRSAVTSGNLKATTKSQAYRNTQITIVAVETPINQYSKKPTYQALTTALKTIAQHLSPNSLIIIESTIAPKTIDHLVIPQIEKHSQYKINQHFLLAHCPERVMPGKLLHNLQNHPRVIGGYNQAATKAAQALYQLITRGQLDLTDTLTAEIVKTAENSYRDVQIAFANELALICQDLGANVWQTRKLINRCPHRDVHLPGAGVGGHCLPKDSWLLIANLTKYQPSLMPTSRNINNSMPLHIISLLKKTLKKASVPLKQAKVTILGYSYLPDSDDTRNSPTIALEKNLKNQVSQINIHDPYVSKFNHPLTSIIKNSHTLILMTAHSSYTKLNFRQIKNLMITPIIIDGRNHFQKEKLEKLGYTYQAIGNTKYD
jgi:UDP-N-acetyl-D-mannosaminuronic acid dehydrogenase